MCSQRCLLQVAMITLHSSAPWLPVCLGSLVAFLLLTFSAVVAATLVQHAKLSERFVLGVSAWPGHRSFGHLCLKMGSSLEKKTWDFGTIWGIHGNSWDFLGWSLISGWILSGWKQQYRGDIVVFCAMIIPYPSMDKRRSIAMDIQTSYGYSMIFANQMASDGWGVYHPDLFFWKCWWCFSESENRVYPGSTRGQCYTLIMVKPI